MNVQDLQSIPIEVLEAELERRYAARYQIPADEWYPDFDIKRRERIALGYHKYGSAKVNYGQKLISAVETLELCIKKYRATLNTEYMVDAGNYSSLEFRYPSLNGAFFKSTDSGESAGIAGMCARDIEAIARETNERY